MSTVTPASVPPANPIPTSFRPEDLFSLRGRAALITGGGGGIGTAVARTLAAAGASVTLADVSPDLAHAAAELVRADGGQASGVQLDVRDEARVRDVVGDVVARHGGIDLLINAAAILERDSALEYDSNAFARVLQINTIGTFLCARTAARAMLAAGHGAIVNFASVAGMVGYGGTPAYQASKAAIIQLTRALALEWAPTIRVNAVAPGSVNTPMTAAIQDNHTEFRAAFINRIPFKRPAEAIEIVGPVLLLCSDAASYITGHVLTVDGGYTVP